MSYVKDRIRLSEYIAVPTLGATAAGNFIMQHTRGLIYEHLRKIRIIMFHVEHLKFLPT